MSQSDDKSKRDLVLAKVLERFSNQIQEQSLKLEEVEKGQRDLISTIKSIELHHDIRLNESETSVEAINQNILRYRSDMLKLVNEQDRLNDLTKDLAKRQISIDGAQERIVSNLSEMEQRYKIQEKTVHDHYAQSLEQSEAFSREVADANRSVIKLHMDTEKRLSQMHSETHKQLEKNRLENMSRLLALDGIESALNTILIRTEPPEKKPFLLFRPFVRLHRFISSKLARMMAANRLRRKSRRNGRR